MADTFDAQDPQDPALAKADTVRVAVRVRPLNAREKSITTNARFSWKVDSTSVAQCDNDKVLQQNIYTFDNVFDQSSTNSQIFDNIAAPVVKSTVDGMNGVIFAYGQTAAGKTYTMLGTESDPGVTRRAIARVFEHVQEQQNRQFLLRASYIEIYNEVIRDLLVPGSENLKIHEDVFNKRVFVDAREEVVLSVDQVMNIIAVGEKAREVGETNMNERSSRSHTIFSLKIESREIEPDAEQDGIAIENNGVAVRASTLSLVDLAGSERASFTKAQGQRLVEGGYINKSLLTLGTVINKLSSGVKLSSGHIPYRDSKLTRLLQPALGGNARTSIICAVTPAVLHMDETISTLKFASRAKKVTNMAKANEYLDDRAKLRKAEKKIAAMRAELELLRGQGSNHLHQFSTGGSPAGHVDEGARIYAFEKMWNRILEKIPSQDFRTTRRSEGNRPISLTDYKRPSLASALDLCAGRVSGFSDGSRDETLDDELAELRKKVMTAEKAKRQAISEIEYERQAMSDEVQILVAGSEDATMERIAAEQDCEQAMSMLAKAQAKSLVDEIVSHAMTRSEISKDLKTARRKLATMDKIRQENQTVKETLAGLRKEHAEAMRREKRGIGPVLKEVRQAQSKLTDLENKLKNARQSNQRMTSERAGLERDIKDRDRKIKVLMSEVERHRKHEEKVQNRIREEIAEEKKKFDIVLEKINVDLNGAREHAQKLQKELENSSRRVDALEVKDKENRADLEANIAEIRELQGDISKTENENSRLTSMAEVQSSKLKEVLTKLKDTEKDRDSLEAYRTKLEEENVRKGDELSKKGEELRTLNLLLEDTQSELDGVQRAKEEILEREQDLTRSLVEANERYDDVVKRTEELQSKLKDGNQSLQKAQEKIHSLESQVENIVDLETALTEAQESMREITQRLSEQQSSEQIYQKRIANAAASLNERGQEIRRLEERLENGEEEQQRLRSEAETANSRHGELLRIVEELERVNGELMKKDCETCVQLRKRLSAVDTPNMNGAAGRNKDLVSMQDQLNKLTLLVEQLTEETAIRTREVLRLTVTIRARDDRLHVTERALDQVQRGEGVVSKLENRVRRRDVQIEAMNRQLEAQAELLRSGGLSAKFTDAQKTCTIESENRSLRESNQHLEERIRIMDIEREEVKEETFKLRDKIKEKDCQRIEAAAIRKENRLKDIKDRNRRSNALREVSANQVGRSS